jgi:acetoin utilization deacetylase AcuC-like enzyme
VKAFFHPGTAAHDPRFFLLRGRPTVNEERPARAEHLLAGLARVGVTAEQPAEFGAGPLAAVHSLDYLRFFATAWDEWQALPDAGEEVIANIHPPRGEGSYPESIVGRAGWHMGDTACPIGPGTWQAACLAADTAVAAAQALLGGARLAYALCRPPGHHAYADRAGGHCFLNNTAIAAQYLLDTTGGRRARIAILDIDVHHGNGTQSIFYQRADVLTVSIHADPHRFYPFYLGHAAERGDGPGAGFNRNMPLPLGTGDAAWLDAIDAGLAHLAAFAPDVVIVALGLDAAATDPFKGFAVTPEGFRAAGDRIAAVPQPLLLVQEGGYLSEHLSDNLAAFLSGALDRRSG